MYHSLFIHSPTERHIGCCQVLAIMNKSSVNTYVQVFYVKVTFQLICINTQKSNCWIRWWNWVCCNNNKPSSKMHYFALLLPMSESSCCSTSSPAFSGASCLSSEHFSRYVVVSYCLIFISWCEVLFIYLLTIHISSWMQCLLRSFAYL
jgi:hypothetical protein